MIHVRVNDFQGNGKGVERRSCYIFSSITKGYEKKIDHGFSFFNRKGYDGYNGMSGYIGDFHSSCLEGWVSVGLLGILRPSLHSSVAG
jgi:hypothetical protein